MLSLSHNNLSDIVKAFSSTSKYLDDLCNIDNLYFENFLIFIFYSEIVNFPFLDGYVPRSPSFGVYISQFIRFVKVCSNVYDYNNGNLFWTAKCLKHTIIDIINFEKH